MNATTVIDQGLLSSTIGQIVAGLIVVFLGTIGTLMVKAIRSLIIKVDDSMHTTKEVHDAVAGREPTNLIPNPAPGLIAVAAGHTQAILDMAAAQQAMANRQNEQNGKVVRIEAAVDSIMNEGIATKEGLEATARSVNLALEQVARDTKKALDKAAKKLAKQAATRQLDVLRAVADREVP